MEFLTQFVKTIGGAFSLVVALGVLGYALKFAWYGLPVPMPQDAFGRILTILLLMAIGSIMLWGSGKMFKAALK